MEIETQVRTWNMTSNAKMREWLLEPKNLAFFSINLVLPVEIFTHIFSYIEPRYWYRF
jgi:hypothetical protein